MSKHIRILLAGGGSGGPVSPVLAVAAAIKKRLPAVEFLFVGTKAGPERALVKEVGIAFVGIRAARLRRYFSLMNVADVFVFLASLTTSFRIMRRFRPDLIFSAGGFVAVPLCWVGKVMGIKIVIHQQDARVGLANKLVVLFAYKITTAFESTAKNFHAGSGLLKKEVTAPKAEWVGNPVRAEIKKPDLSQKIFFHLHDELPILLILGGATGAAQINDLISQILPDLVRSHQVIHQTGKGKNTITFSHPNYHAYELIPFGPYAAILNLAHLVIARAGLSTIAELAAAGKISIIIPMPNSHQEDNGKILEEAHAAIVLGKDIAAQELLKIVRSLEFNPQRQKLLSNNIKTLMPKDAESAIAKIIAEELNK